MIASPACLAADGDTDPVDVRRSKAVGICAQPALALALLQRHATGDQTTPMQPVAVDPDKLRPHATLFVRLSEESLASGTGVAASNVGVLTVQQVRTCSGTAGSPSGRSWTSATSCRWMPTRSRRNDGRR